MCIHSLREKKRLHAGPRIQFGRTHASGGRVHAAVEQSNLVYPPPNENINNTDARTKKKNKREMSKYLCNNPTEMRFA